jgi:DNA polymerase III delta prime subunit
MAVQIRKASRKKVKMRMAFEGPAGSGKTTSALLVAKGLCGSLDKVIVIDTENRSSELYANLGDFSVIEMTPPFSPEKFIEAIKAAENADFEVIIIDSASAEWIGKGGILDIHGAMPGNSFTNWAKIGPRHQAFIDAMLQSTAHVICNLRTKTEYVLVEKNGKQVPEKVGMKSETRDNLDYEMTIVFTMDIKNNASTSKDRTNLFFNKPQFIPTEETGKLIAAWCEAGEDTWTEDIKADWVRNLEACENQKQLVELYNKNKAEVDTNPMLQMMLANRRNMFNGKSVNA